MDVCILSWLGNVVLLTLISISDVCIRSSYAAVVANTVRPTVTLPKEAPPKLPNCTIAAKPSSVDITGIEALQHPLTDATSKKSDTSSQYNSKNGPSNAAIVNCTGRAHGAEVSYVQHGDHGNAWKTRIIISCTIAASIEVVIVVLIVLYWKEIRWTIRKISCPCISRQQSGSHEVMAEDAMSSDRYATTEDTDAQSNGFSVRLYSSAAEEAVPAELEQLTPV